MYLVIILLPLIMFLLVFFFSKFFGKAGTFVLCFSGVFVSFFLSIINLCGILIDYKLVLIDTYVTWIQCGKIVLTWSFVFDSLSSVMVFVILSISLLVHIYSYSYMSEDPHISRFMSYLTLFTFFMLILVTAPNFCQLFLGWEGVGLCSYLLINFWFTRNLANRAAMKALIMNRVGDISLLIAICLLYCYCGSFDFFTIFSIIPFFCDKYILFCGFEIHYISFVSLLLFIAAVGKSAQLGLHTWLPDAMEGPTPVSALIHAATMVTAGVYLIVRCSPIIEYSEFVLNLMVLVGGLTVFFGSSVAMFQNDIKKVIAYSTCSQLGYMIMGCGLSSYNVSMYHLFNHAFFKALLFLGAGAIIHCMNDEQDMRRMGGLLNLMPFTYCMMLIGSLSLIGFPYMSGFYSKDLILEVAFAKYSVESIFCYWVGTFSAGMTSFYSFKLLYLVFFREPAGYKRVYLNVNEVDFFMGFPLAVLSLFSIFSGYFFKEVFVGFGTTFWGNSIFVLPNHLYLIEAEFIPLFFKLLPTIFGFFGIFLFIFFNSNFFFDFFFKNKFKIYVFFYDFFVNKWYIDFIYNFFFVKPVFFFGYYISFKKIDKCLFEIFGPFGIYFLIARVSVLMSKFQSGYIHHYIFMVFFGYAVILWFCVVFIKNIELLVIFFVYFFFIKMLTFKNPYYIFIDPELWDLYPELILEYWEDRENIKQEIYGKKNIYDLVDVRKIVC